MKVINGQTLKIRKNTLETEVCCDCGLVHTVLYEIKRNYVLRTVFRDDWQTRGWRRRRKKEK